MSLRSRKLDRIKARLSAALSDKERRLEPSKKKSYAVSYRLDHQAKRGGDTTIKDGAPLFKSLDFPADMPSDVCVHRVHSHLDVMLDQENKLYPDFKHRLAILSITTLT